MILADGALHLMRLLDRDKDKTGWTQCSQEVADLIRGQYGIPAELYHCNGNSFQLTDEAKAVLKWL